jgi:glycolate oxidase FAD binding subunit
VPVSVADLQEQIVVAGRQGETLAIRGGGTRPWRAAGSAGVLEIGDYSGIVSYQPAELVITVKAGTPLLELDAVLAEQGQALAAQCPVFGVGSTIGAAVALGWSGSGRPYTGALRDVILGARMINGAGEVLGFGGQVMKNVAGYDVPRLLCGSAGRLGLILELSLKLQPQPERELTLRLQCAQLEQARSLVRDYLQRGEPLTAASWQGGALRLRFSGRGSTMQRLLQASDGLEEEALYWERLRRFELPLFENRAAAWRLDPSQPLSEQDLPGDCLFDWGGALCWYQGSLEPAALEALSGPGRAVSLGQGPVWPCAEGGPVAQLQTRLAQAFDPGGVFSPACNLVGGEH